MHRTQDYYPKCPEALIVSLARNGDRSAFAELVRRRQAPVRNLMRRCCNDAAMADDLAQQVFIKVWLNLRALREIKAFGAWLKRLAISVWLQHVRKKDVLRNAGELTDVAHAQHDSPGVGMDLDEALAVLTDPVRLCIVLSYHEGLSHREIADLTEYPLGTVKSHINRGSEQLRQFLSAYGDEPAAEDST